MEEKEETIKKWNEIKSSIDFQIPETSTSKYYMNMIDLLIEKNAKVIFDDKTIFIISEENNVQNGIVEIVLYLGNRFGEKGLYFVVKTKHVGTDIQSAVDFQVTKDSEYRELEEVNYSINNKDIRQLYHSNYGSDGLCKHRSKKDYNKKEENFVALYQNGILLSEKNKDTCRSAIISANYQADARKQVGIDIKHGTAIQYMNSNDAKEVPYQKHKVPEEDFEKLRIAAFSTPAVA